MLEEKKTVAFDNGLEYHVFKDYEIHFDEKGSSCGVVRMGQWVRPGQDPDPTRGKIEIRKLYYSSGEERSGKGYTFATDDGPNELVHGLVKAGFGDTKEILRAVRSRADFLEAAQTIDEDNEGTDDGEMFDMRDLFKDAEQQSDYEDEDDMDDAC